MVSSGVHCLAVLIFHLCWVQTLAPVAACPASCVCEKTLLVNCASLGLSKAPLHIPATATDLDLSHNALQSLAPLGSSHMHLRGLQHLRVGNNSLESLSMCSGMTRRTQGCVSWAPDLHSLYAERNQLKCLPRGLGNIKSLKVLQLSHNRISDIGPADLAGCTHLRELHLQHNLITTIHPEAFKDLQKLKVLDVSRNLLAAIPVPAYLSLRKLNALVDVSGNRWRCDCNLKTLRRWLSFVSELGNPTWEVVCFSPSCHAGKDLLYLEESDLTCPQPVYNTPGVKKEVTVDEGMEFILYCSTANPDFIHTRWWTPHGQISDSQQFLHIANTTERDAGLYVCVSGFQEEHVSVFNLHVRQRVHDRRLRREARIGSLELNGEDNDNLQRNVPSVRTVQRAQFVLAVCLSVFITFVVAFVLGALLRPRLEKFYKQAQNKRNSNNSPSNSQTSSTGQRPYVNEGYSDTDDQEHEVREGPRVTFGGVTEIREQGGVPYYVTVEESPSRRNTDVEVLYENAEKKEFLTENIEVYKEVPLREANKEMTSPRSKESLNADSSKGMQFEYIPDPGDTTELGERSTSPASSLSDEPQMSYEAKESTEQSVDSPTVSIYADDDEQASTHHQAMIPGFITDPFPLKMSKSKEESVDELDPDLWNDSGDSFSFTEGSPRSSSRVSNVAAPLNQKEMCVDEPSNRPSSSTSGDSGESEEGPTKYTVSSEDDGEDSETQISYSENDDINYGENRLSPFEEDILTEDQKTGTGTRFRQDTITLDPTDIHMTHTRGESFDDESTDAEYKESFNFSNISIDSEDEPTQYHVHPVYRSSQKTTSLMGEDRSHNSSFSEEDEDKQEVFPGRLEIRFEDKVPSTDATPVISPDRLLIIDYDNSSSTTDIEEKRSKEKERGILKGLSALLFNRSGSETNKKSVWPEPNTATTTSKGTGGFLGLSFKKQPMTPSENVNPTTNENFFATIGQAFDRLPKLKNSLLFSISAPKSRHQQESTSVVDRISKSERPHESSCFDDSIFGTLDQILDPIPRVKRYLHFSQNRSRASVQAPAHFTGEEVRTESKKYTFSSEDDASPNSQDHHFFGQIDASFDEVPKVKRYIQFSQSEPQLSSHSAASAPVTQVSRPTVLSKTESPSDTINVFFEGRSISLPAIPKVPRHVQFTQPEPQTVHKLTQTIKGAGFLGQIPISFDEVPKVKRHMLFSQSEPQLSSHSAASAPITKVDRPRVVSKTESPSDTINIFFEGRSTSLPAIPKVQRYVQFTKLEPQTVQKFTPSIKGDGFLGQIPISFDEVPKVKRCVQFSQSEPQLSSHSAALAPVTQVSRPTVLSKTESPSDTINIFFEGLSTSLPAIPKVQRYVRFIHLEPQTVPKITQTIKGDGFLRQIPISFDDVPKVKRHMLFSQSEPQLSSHSAALAPVTQVARPTVLSKTESPSDTINIFFKGKSTSLPAIPNVQRYVQFTQPEPQTVQKLTPSIKGDGFLGQIPISFDDVPKVKRHMLFSQSVSPYHASKKRYPLTDEQITHEIKRALVAKAYAKPGVGDHFFGEINASVEGVPKVKKYIQFTQSEVSSESLSPYFPLNEKVVTMQAGTEVKSNNSPSKDCNPVVDEHNFFGRIGVFFDGIPKVKRRIQFTEYSVRLPESKPPSSLIQPVRPAVTAKTSRSTSDAKSSLSKTNFFEVIHVALDNIPKVNRSLQFTQFEAEASNQSILPFSGQMDIFFNKVPKVKRYLQFIKSEPQRSAQSPSSSVITECVKPGFSTKTQSKRSEAAASPSIKGDNFFVQIGTSLHGLPKLKRYIQFTQSDLQPSARSQSLPVTAEHVIPGTLTTRQSTRSEVKASPSIKGDDCFSQMGSSFDRVPKVKRYIQFTQAEPCLQPLLLHSLTNKTEKTIKVLESEDYGQPTAGRHNFFGPTGASSEIPKVRRYIQFSQHSTQPSSLSLHRQIVTPVLIKPELGRSISLPVDKSSNEDTFFRKMDASVSELPKVKRYIQFTQQCSIPPMSPKTHGVTVEVPKKREVWGSDLSMVDVKPPVTEDNFFGQLGTNLNSLPKVNRYIQFTQAEPYASSRTPSPTENLTKKEWKILSSSINNDAKSSTKDTFFDGISASLENIPKVKKALLFTQSKYQNSNQTQVQKKVTPQLVTKLESVGFSSLSEKESVAKQQDNFFGQTGVSLDEVPKVERYIQFSQSKAYPPTRSSVNIKGVQSPSPIFKTEIVTPELATKTESSSGDSSFEKTRRTVTEGDTFLGQTGTSFDEVPKVKRYLQFIKSELQPLPQSPSTSVITEHVTPEFSTKMQSTRSEHKVSPTIKGGDFFGQTGPSFDGVPKLKRYIQFTQAEPHFQPSPLLHLLTNKAGKVKDLASEDCIQPTAGEPTGASFEIPRVRRYIQFSQHSTQPSAVSLHRQTATPTLTKADLGRSSSSPVDGNEDIIFRNNDSSLGELPKVKRFIQFTQQHSASQPSNTHGITVDVPKKTELWGSDLSAVPVTEDRFLVQQGTNLPKVNRYIQFTQSESYLASQSPSPTEKMTRKEWTTLSSSNDNDAKSSTKHAFFDGISASLDNIPKVKRALQFTKTEHQAQTAAYGESGNAADILFESPDLPLNQIPKVKRYVQIVQSEPDQSPPMKAKDSGHSDLESEQSFPFKDEFRLTTKEKDSLKKDGVPRLIRYIQYRQSEPPSQTSSLSSQQWETMDAETESRMFKTNAKQASAGDHVPHQIRTRTENPLTSTNSDQYDQTRARLSRIQDMPSAMKVITETSRLNQLPEPKRSPVSSNPDAYGHPDQVFHQAEAVFTQTSSNSSSGDKKYTITQRSSSRTESSTMASETMSDSKLSGLVASSNESALQTGKRQVMDPALQDASQSIPDTHAASSVRDDAKEYLRESSLARQRQERRRLLFQQKRRAMDGFSLTSESFTSQESDQ